MRPRPDAAENAPDVVAAWLTVRAGFNEAAARCRGKPPRRRPTARRRLCASMRPRPDAAENRRWRWSICASVPRLASMRPRPDAAENTLRLGAVLRDPPLLQ